MSTQTIQWKIRLIDYRYNPNGSLAFNLKDTLIFLNAVEHKFSPIFFSFHITQYENEYSINDDNCAILAAVLPCLDWIVK